MSDKRRAKKKRCRALKHIERRKLWRAQMERPPAVRTCLVSRWSVLLPNLGRRNSAHLGPARLSAVIICPLLQISASKWFALLKRFYHPPDKCYTSITVSRYLAEANWLSLINRHSWGLDECEGRKRSLDFLHRARRRGYGVECAEGRGGENSALSPQSCHSCLQICINLFIRSLNTRMHAHMREYTFSRQTVNTH